MNISKKKTILVNVHVNNRETDWISKLEYNYNAKFSDAMPAHMFFSFCSLAIIVITDEILFTEKQNVISRVVESQQKFRNSLTICAGLSRKAFEEIQNHIPFGRMRIVHCQSNGIFPIIQMYVTLTNDHSKAKLQADYFEDSKASLLKNETAKLICNNWLCNDLLLDKSESQLLMEGFPSMLQIFETSRRTLEDCSPVDIVTINKLIGFTTFAITTSSSRDDGNEALMDEEVSIRASGEKSLEAGFKRGGGGGGGGQIYGGKFHSQTQGATHSVPSNNFESFFDS